MVLFTFKRGPFILVKIPQRNGISGKNGFQTPVLSPSHDIHIYTTKQLNCLTPCTVCTDACERKFITKSRIHPQNQSYESALSVVSKIITYTLLWAIPTTGNIMASILFHFESSTSNNTGSQVMALFQCIFGQENVQH